MTLTQVAIRRGDTFVTVPLGEFLDMPLEQRLTLILEGSLKFYDDQGELISTKEGLKLLREMRQAHKRAAG